MLASVMGVDEDEASERLDRTVLVTAAADSSSRNLASEIVALLERTLHVSADPAAEACLELVVGRAAPRASVRRIYADADADRAVVDASPVPMSTGEPHALFAAIAASFAVAAVISMAVDSGKLPKVALPMAIRFDQLGISSEALDRTIDLDGAVLVGAGAIGNAFLRALRHVRARGRLPIVDPKKVGGGNPNRCLFLTAEDVGTDKACALAHNAQANFTAVELVPFVETFHDYVAREGVQRTAIVTVDSRRVRRSIQSEVPGQVFDASTTDIRAVVVHSHRQPTAHACLSCIYRHVPDESVREQAIADGLGIGLEMVRENLISSEAAEKISSLHGISAAEIQGTGYDSLFKALCAEQALMTPEGRQVLAPFAFVSGLAGALLVVEMLRSEPASASTNYWQVDPWGAPIDRLRALRPRSPDCEFCSRSTSLSIVEAIWGPRPGRSGVFE